MAPLPGLMMPPGLVAPRGGYLPATLLLHFEGANGSQSFPDSSGNDLDFAAFGTGRLSTAQARFGTSSYFNNGGKGGGYALGNYRELVIGTQDFTIDFWVFRVSGGGTYVDFRGQFTHWNSARPCIESYNTQYVGYYVLGDYRITSTAPLTANTWKHVAVTRASGTTRLFVDGVLQGSWADSTNYGCDNERPSIGYRHVNNESSGANHINGYIDELRIVVGAAEWTRDFTPPTKPYKDG